MLKLLLLLLVSSERVRAVTRAPPAAGATRMSTSLASLPPPTDELRCALKPLLLLASSLLSAVACSPPAAEATLTSESVAPLPPPTAELSCALKPSLLLASKLRRRARLWRRRDRRGLDHAARCCCCCFSPRAYTREPSHARR